MTAIGKQRLSKFLALFVQVGPIVGVTLWQFPLIIARSPWKFSWAAFLLVFMVLMIVRKDMRKFFDNSPALVLSTMACLLGYLFMTFGYPLMVIGGASVASCTASIPLHMWNKKLGGAIEEDKEQLTMTKLIEKVKGGKHNGDKKA